MRWPLVRDNITRADRDAVIAFLSQDDPRLTMGEQVAAFEREFADWLGVKYAVMVNSGSSANLVTIAALGGTGEIIVPTLTWVSDITAVLHAGMTPVFVDIDPWTLGMDWRQVNRAIINEPRGIFLTHVLGFDGLKETPDIPLIPDGIRLVHPETPLIEDCCEALGATHQGKKLGTFGLASNFSFYYAHHMSTIEGGMICTDDDAFAKKCRMLRDHGRRVGFKFELPGWNLRPTEINAVIGRNQLKRLDANISDRTYNLKLFLDGLDKKYRTDYRVEGSSNYAFPLILAEPNAALMQRVMVLLDREDIEFRSGTAGGGNQLRQKYARDAGCPDPKAYPEVEHVTDYGLYLGNFPGLKRMMICELCDKLNAL